MRNMGFGSRIARDLEYTERMRPSEGLKKWGYENRYHTSNNNKMSLNRQKMFTLWRAFDITRGNLRFCDLVSDSSELTEQQENVSGNIDS